MQNQNDQNIEPFGHGGGIPPLCEVIASPKVHICLWKLYLSLWFWCYCSAAAASSTADEDADLKTLRRQYAEDANAERGNLNVQPFRGEATSSPHPTRRRRCLWTRFFVSASSPLAGQAHFPEPPQSACARRRKSHAVTSAAKSEQRPAPSFALLASASGTFHPPIPIARPLPSPRGLRLESESNKAV